MLPGGGHLGQRLGTCLKALQLGRVSPAWLAYLDHITDIVKRGLCDTALTSLSYMQSLVSPKCTQAKPRFQQSHRQIW